jgi:hypothetical protein
MSWLLPTPLLLFVGAVGLEPPLIRRFRPIAEKKASAAASVPAESGQVAYSSGFSSPPASFFTEAVCGAKPVALTVTSTCISFKDKW